MIHVCMKTEKAEKSVVLNYSVVANYDVSFFNPFQAFYRLSFLSPLGVLLFFFYFFRLFRGVISLVDSTHRFVFHFN